MTLEDICENNISRRTFKYRNKEERTIIIQVFLSVLGSKSEAFNGSTYSASKKTIYIDLTDLEYAEISDMVAFFKSQFNKEKKRLMKDIPTLSSTNITSLTVPLTMMTRQATRK